MGHIPVGMEMFSAADEQQWDVIKKQIDQSDYYVVIIAHRYGSMDGNISFTEKEYDYAVARGLPALGFIIDDSTDWPSEWKENNHEIAKRLNAFRSKVSGRMVSFWKGSDDLYGRAGIALMKAFSTSPREGWVRAGTASTKEMTDEITRLSRENGLLRNQLEAYSEASVEDKQAELNQTIDALRVNKRAIYVWLRDADSWGEPISTNLLAIFEAIAPDLLDEASNKTISDSLGLRFASSDVRSYGWPVPSNFVKAYIADFVSLGLVSTSPKRHSVSDTKAYWSLTDFGKKVHANIRKNELLKGLAEFETIPEEGPDTEVG